MGALVQHDSVSFTEDYVTKCLENDLPIFEWNGDKGLVRNWKVDENAGRWKLVVVLDGADRGKVCARPTGGQTLRIFREAKVREYKRLGIEEIFSRIYLRRVRFIRHSMAENTVKWVWKHYLIPNNHLDILDRAADQIAAARELGYVVETSEAKFEAWVRIIHVLRRDDKGFEYALRHGPSLGMEAARTIMVSDDPIAAAHCYGLDTEGLEPHVIKKAATLWYYYCKANS